jgi:hypothetical protein
VGYTVDLEGRDLWCKSRQDAEAAQVLIEADEEMSYHLQVCAMEASVEQFKGTWFLCVEHFQGDHWNDPDARQLWLKLAPHMGDGAVIEFQGEEGDRWRIRWQDGRVFEEFVTEVIWHVNEEITAPAEEKSS